MVGSYFDFLDIEPVQNSCVVAPDGKRELVREYISKIEKDNPGVKYSIFASLGNIDTKSLCLKENMHANSH